MKTIRALGIVALVIACSVLLALFFLPSLHIRAVKAPCISHDGWVTSSESSQDKAKERAQYSVIQPSEEPLDLDSSVDADLPNANSSNHKHAPGHSELDPGSPEYFTLGGGGVSGFGGTGGGEAIRQAGSNTALGGGHGGDHLAGSSRGFRGSIQSTRRVEIPAPGPGEELWILIKPETPSAPPEDVPGTGCLMARLPDAQREVPVPLKHTDVKARISGYIATVDVTQTFHNPYGSKIEAVYVFPLPQNAAVNDFLMTIGDRRIRGIIRERQEAERIYTEARSQGYVASLLTQERPNIFTQRVANIEPAKEISVNILYFQTLAYVDGFYEYHFPMVVGPRYNPAGSTDGVGAVGVGKHGLSGQTTEVQYLKPGERSGHDISLAVDLDAGVPLESVTCSSHVASVRQKSPSRASVVLSPNDAIPNKDFVLRYKVAGNRVKSAFLTHTNRTGSYFSLMLYPPDDLKTVQRRPVEMVFVMDCSGSMSGKPIAVAKAAASRALRKLEADDTFQIISFNNSASALGAAPLPATPENVRRGLRYLDSLEGSGGTEMNSGIKAALDFPHNPDRLRLVSFMTDGYIGNEDEILGEISKRLRDTRIFSFGVGTSTNRYLLDNMALMGRGAVAYIPLDGDSSSIVDLFYDRIRHPALTDIKIDWGSLKVDDAYPRRIPDLFVGRPVVLTGRCSALKGETVIRVSGKVGDRDVRFDVPVSADSDSPGIDKVWARMKIADLSARGIPAGRDSKLTREILQVALEHNLMSACTAFVAVDSLTRTKGDSGTTVPVPVPVPDGVKYGTTVQD